MGTLRIKDRKTSFSHPDVRPGATSRDVWVAVEQASTMCTCTQRHRHASAIAACWVRRGGSERRVEAQLDAGEKRVETLRRPSSAVSRTSGVRH